MSYIVNIAGSDPFIARSIPAIKRGLHDLYDGKVIDEFKSLGSVRITYVDNCGIELNIVAHKSGVYR